METVFSTDQKIINTLLLNASFIDNLGLMHGKMGISIFFFHIARQTKNKIYEDYAGELIDEIYDEITANTPVDFENGLAGIGWGIEYLVQNNFIEADTDEVLEEFDNRIFKELIYNTPKEIGLLDDIIGIGVYYLKRIQNPTSSEKIPALTNKQTLIHLIGELERKTQNIAEITSEPFNSSLQGVSRTNNRQTFKLLNDSRTFEQPNHEQQTTHKIFDLTWNYPVLLWFLAEFHEQNIFNLKVEKIIQCLVEPLSDNTNLPKLQSNRLLLALALTKLKQTIETTGTKATKETPGTIETIETTIPNLFTNINRETIKSELPPDNDTIRYGTSGIAWVYKQLFELTNEKQFKQEMEYWTNLSYTHEGADNGFAGFDIKIDGNAFGLLAGLAGVGLFRVPYLVN